MRELPILACDSVARNLWDGTQTQHRVPCKNLEFGSDVTSKDILGYDGEYLQVANTWMYGHPVVVQYVEVKAPWSVGDVLYVREAAACVWWITDSDTGYADDWGNADKWPATKEEFKETHLKLMYRAQGDWETNAVDRGFKWTPNILVPKWASRTRLLVKRVWCERVQDISEKDILAEGITTNLREHDACCDLHDKWRNLWISLYGKDSWGRNDWVWACEFRKL